MASFGHVGTAGTAGDLDLGMRIASAALPKKKFMIHPQGRNVHVPVMSQRPIACAAVGNDVPMSTTRFDVNVVEPERVISTTQIISDTVDKYLFEPATEHVKAQIAQELTFRLNDEVAASTGIPPQFLTGGGDYSGASISIGGSLTTDSWVNNRITVTGEISINPNDITWSTTGTTDGTSITGSVYYSNDNGTVVQDWSESKDYIKQTIRDVMKNNLLIKMGRTRKSLKIKVSAPELKARDTLRDVISEREWRRYVTNGFIMVKGNKEQDGTQYFYQIFADTSKRVQVFKGNKHIHNLCIHSDGVCPPTDHVINMKVLAEMDERELWKGSNVYSASKQNHERTVHNQSNILDFSKRLREAA